MKELQGLKLYIVSHGVGLAVAILIAVIGFIVLRLVRRRLMLRIRAHRTGHAMKYFLVNFGYGVCLAILGVIVLGKLGVPTTSLIAVLGAGTLAVGLALRDSLSNVAAGIIIVFQKPFQVGDFVESNGASGTVAQINLLQTRIVSPNNETIYIPNAKILNDKFINKTMMGTRRIDFTVGIAYDAEIDSAKNIIAGALGDVDGVLTQPAPYIGVDQLADSSVNLTIRVWAKCADFAKVRFSLLETVKGALDANNIGIPFPQRDVHIQKVDE